MNNIRIDLLPPEQKVGGSNPLGRTNSFIITCLQFLDFVGFDIDLLLRGQTVDVRISRIPRGLDRPSPTALRDFGSNGCFTRSVPVSKASLDLSPLSRFSTTWGFCFSLKGNSSRFSCERFCHGFATACLTPPFRLRPSRPTNVPQRMPAVGVWNRAPAESAARRLGARRRKCNLLVR
jgi:hypothetical protein